MFRVSEIKFKLLAPVRRQLAETGAVGAGWDLHVRPIAEVPKVVSMHEHFVQGVPWLRTTLFREVYALRLVKGEMVKGCRDLSELSQLYDNQVGELFRSIKSGGFWSVERLRKEKIDLPVAYRSSDGGLIFGDQGNHRLGIAGALQLQEMPLNVVTFSEQASTVPR
jgi:hypothetical protein